MVSTPFLIYFWRRQADRRDLYPAANGWTLYLSFIELVFMTAFVVSAVTFVNGLIGDEPASAWASAVVFGLIIVFHELATRRTPPLSEAGELPRVIGSAIGLITAAGGLFGSLAEVFATLFGVGDVGWHPWLAMAIVGLPVWAYRWLRPWPSPRESVPRLAWTTAVTVGAMAVAVGSATSLLVLGLQYVVGDTQPAGSHFEPAPIALGLLFPSILIAIVHRRALGAERNTQIRFVDYAMAAIGLVTAVIAAIALTVVAFDRSLIVGGGVEDVILFATVLVVGLAQWWVFTRRTARGDEESEKTSWPRRIYHLGLGVGFGLVAAGTLITTLVIVLRRLMDGETEGSLLTPLTIFIYTALATWYLLSAYAQRSGDDGTRGDGRPVRCDHHHLTPGDDRRQVPQAGSAPSAASWRRCRGHRRGDGRCHRRRRGKSALTGLGRCGRVPGGSPASSLITHCSGRLGASPDEMAVAPGHEGPRLDDRGDPPRRAQVRDHRCPTHLELGLLPVPRHHPALRHQGQVPRQALAVPLAIRMDVSQSRRDPGGSHPRWAG